MKRWFLKKLNIEIEDLITDIDRKEKIKILTYAVKRLFNTISSEDILKENEFGQWLYMGKPLTDSDKNLLMSEAVQLQHMKLWKILKDDIRYQANRKMFLLSKDEDSLTAGKLWAYTLDSIDTRLKNMTKSKGIPTNSDF
jgi:hypothetical protein